jgi:hypothetical protein
MSCQVDGKFLGYEVIIALLPIVFAYNRKFDNETNYVARGLFYIALTGLLGLIIGIVLSAFGLLSETLFTPLLFLIIGSVIGFIYINLSKKGIEKLFRANYSQDIKTKEHSDPPIWAKPLLARGLWGSLLSPLVISLVIIFIIIAVKSDLLFSSIGIITLIIIIWINGIREFYKTTEILQNSIQFTINQLLTTHGSYIEKLVKEDSLDPKAKIRAYIMLYSPKDNKLDVRFSYNMAGDLDSRVRISPTQDVTGKAFRTRRIWLKAPYTTEDLGFTQQQIKFFPSDIKWKMAIPLMINNEPIGVFGMDGNVAVDLDVLGKIRDYSFEIIGRSLVVLLAQNPSKVVQEAFEGIK